MTTGRTNGGQPDIPTASGREAHPHRVSVYLSEAEFTALEAYRLHLLRSTRTKLDRGRIIRGALMTVLGPFMQSNPERDQT